MEPISRRNALAVLLAPLLAAGCSFDSILAPSRTKRSLSLSATEPEMTLIGSGDAHAKSKLGYTAQTGALVASMLAANPNARAFMVGDLVQNGREVEYGYYHQTWGPFKDRTDFQIGNKDLLIDPTGTWWQNYTQSEFHYAKTYGLWRIYYLDSMSGNFDEQTQWLTDDLPQYSPTHHIAAMWHQPMFASVCRHSRKAMTHPGELGAWWNILRQHGAEFVCSGHAHRYERFARMIRRGEKSETGIRQFVLGTGGPEPMPILTVHPNSERQVVTRGTMKFDLYSDRYEWTFTDLSGVVQDQDVQPCRKVLI